MIEELQIKHFTELCRKYTSVHFSLEIFLELVDFMFSWSTTPGNFPLTNMQESTQSPNVSAAKGKLSSFSQILH